MCIYKLCTLAVQINNHGNWKLYFFGNLRSRCKVNLIVYFQTAMLLFGVVLLMHFWPWDPHYGATHLSEDGLWWNNTAIRCSRVGHPDSYAITHQLRIKVTPTECCSLSISLTSGMCWLVPHKTVERTLKLNFASVFSDFHVANGPHIHYFLYHTVDVCC